MALLMKIILIGDGSVGKTSLRRRFMGQFLENEYIQTIGADLSIKNLKIYVASTPTTVQYQIWDLSGQQHFSNVRPIYYKGASGILLVYDMTNRSSFENIIYWIEEVRTKSDKKYLPLILFANKLDLRCQVNSPIDSAEGLLLAKRIAPLYYGATSPETVIPYFETSAKTGENVEQAFLTLAEMIMQKSKQKKRFFI